MFPASSRHAGRSRSVGEVCDAVTEQESRATRSVGGSFDLSCKTSAVRDLVRTRHQCITPIAYPHFNSGHE